MIGTQPIVKNNLCPKPKPPSLRAFSKFKFESASFNIRSAGLIDTGSNVSLIDVNILPKRFANRLQPDSNPVKGIGGVTNVIGTVTGKCFIGDAEFPNVKFQVVEKLPSSARIIIGTNILLHQNISKLSIERVAKRIHFEFQGQDSDSKVLKMSQYYDDIECADTMVTCNGTQQNENENTNAKNKVPRFETLREKLEYLQKEHDIPLYHSNKDYLEKFADMIIANLSVFGIDGELGCFPTPVAIETKGEPVKIKQHEIAQQFRQDVDKEVSKMLQTGVIEKIKDPKGWNSPILCVAKRDKSVRVCANFKNTINKRLCRPDPFPAPAIEEVFKSIEDGNKFFSSIDLQSGYWQLTIREPDRHKTAFTWRGQTYQFVRLPFGYTAAGNAFSRAVWEALLSVDFDQQHVKSYIDDICILGKDIDMFVANHVQVFEALKSFNLRLKARKCHFLKEEIPFLGCLLSAQGRRPMPEYVEGIMNIKAPTNLKELKQAQGRLTWINGFIGSRMGEEVKKTSFSHLIDPILNVSRKAPFKWTEEADKALETIKERMTKPPFISFSDPNLPYVLITDASDTALGGMLCQKKGEEYRVIGTVSKCFSPSERRWSTTEREAYAIVYCVKKFSYFLTRTHFTVFTDHKSLTFMDRKTFNNAKISRWQTELSQYSFHVQYLEGDENVWADWLSRPYLHIANSHEEKTDKRPAGKFIKIDGTKMTIYVPSWCLDALDPDLTKLRFKNDRKDVLCAVAFDTSRTDEQESKPMISEDFDYRPIIDVEHGLDQDTLPLSLAAFVTEKELPENPELFQYLDMAKEQRSDPLLKKIICRLESPETLQPGQLTDYIDSRDERSLWFKKNAENLFLDPMTKLLMLREPKSIKMVVPESMRKQMLYSAHDLMGHCGRNRVLEHLSSMVWPGKYKDTEDYVKSCVGCSEVKGNYGKRPTNPGHNLRGKVPNEVLYLDYIFLSKTKSGYQYALTIIDSFTRYVSVYPSRNNRACDTARFLTDYVVKFGRIPSVISTDRGSHFVGAVMQDLCKSLGIKHNIHCAYRPQSTGILERAHRTLKNSLKIVAKELSKPWPEVLGHVVGAMNACFNEATKCSPFYAMFGKNYCLDIPRLPEKDASRTESFDALSHGMNLDAAMVKIHRLVDLCAKDTDHKADSSRRETNIEKLTQGDKVLIYRPLSAAANAKVEWISGYTVLESNDFAAKLKNEENGKTDWVHRNHIRKIHKRPSYLEYDSDDEDEDTPQVTLHEKSDPDNSISRGVVADLPFANSTPDMVDIEPSSSVPPTSPNSDSRNVTLVDENQMAKELKDALKEKQAKRRGKINRWSSEGLSKRKSKREKKAPERFEVKSMRGKSYDT